MKILHSGDGNYYLSGSHNHDDHSYSHGNSRNKKESKTIVVDKTKSE